jgi:predicted transcriptional regulator
MTELDEAVADVRREPERLARMAAALYLASRKYKQVDIVKRTGLTRETVRRHVEDEKIRRGEIDPTRRYLREQARRNKRRES